MSYLDPRRTSPCYRFARTLHGLVEREDVPPPEVNVVRVRDGSEGVVVTWPLGGRRVTVTVRPGLCYLGCHSGFRIVWRVDLRHHGVDSLRRAVAWLVGDVPHPEARP
jgi:hypothetical protein